MTLAEIAQTVLGEALAARTYPVELTVSPHLVDLVVRDHRVVIEVRHGVVRVVYVHPAPGEGPATRDQRVVLDDADAEVVGGMVRQAIAVGLTPF